MSDGHLASEFLPGSPQNIELQKPNLSSAKEGRQLGSDRSNDISKEIINEAQDIEDEGEEEDLHDHDLTPCENIVDDMKMNGFQSNEIDLLGMGNGHHNDSQQEVPDSESAPSEHPNIVPRILIEEDKEYFDDSGYLDKRNGDSGNWQPMASSPNLGESHEFQMKFDDDNFAPRRSQRNIRKQSFSNILESGFNIQENSDEREFRLIKCCEFEEGEQPNLIFVSFQALLLMNIHAHLFSNEIIGFCGGQEFRHKSGKKALYIHDAYPTKAIEDVCYDRTKSVEMDPESLQATARLIESRNQIVCSWYHSHPIFETNPSCMDIANQHNHQMMYSKDKNQPYVGFIVGPYTQKLNSCRVISEFTCFKVEEVKSKENGQNQDSEAKSPFPLEAQNSSVEKVEKKPYCLEVTIVPQKQVNKRVIDSIKDIFDIHSVAGDKINLSQKWKGKMTKIEKLRKCVKMLITQNNENASNFSLEELVDIDSSFNAVELSTSTDDDNNIDIDFDQLCSEVKFLEKAKFKKKERKRGRPKSNKIVLNIAGDEPKIVNEEEAKSKKAPTANPKEAKKRENKAKRKETKPKVKEEKKKDKEKEKEKEKGKEKEKEKKEPKVVKKKVKDKPKPKKPSKKVPAGIPSIFKVERCQRPLKKKKSVPINASEK
ncbi:unnamed protein product [Moneuplotes crassus]|uniref:MPN domain-containing protein n=1 Tax=Euplotes crassus TaxID=5936 RepID=A0AAD2DAM3_EUPCR|nr:unnamed protein product [Moneuplotes crassus]